MPGHPGPPASRTRISFWCTWGLRFLAEYHIGPGQLNHRATVGSVTVIPSGTPWSAPASPATPRCGWRPSPEAAGCRRGRCYERGLCHQAAAQQPGPGSGLDGLWDGCSGQAGCRGGSARLAKGRAGDAAHSIHGGGESGDPYRATVPLITLSASERPRSSGVAAQARCALRVEMLRCTPDLPRRGRGSTGRCD